MAFNVSDIFKTCEELLKFLDSEQRYFSIEVNCLHTNEMEDAKSLIDVLMSRGKVLSSLTFKHCIFDQRDFAKFFNPIPHANVLRILDCIQHARSVVFKKPATPLTTENIEKLVSVLQGAENLGSLIFEEWDDLTPEMNELLAPHLKTISERASNSEDEAKDAELLNIFDLWSLRLGKESRSKEFQEFTLNFVSLEKYGDRLAAMLAGTEILVEALVKNGKELYGMVFKDIGPAIMSKDEVHALFKNIKHVKTLLHFEDAEIHSKTTESLKRHTTEHQLKQPGVSSVRFVRCDLRNRSLVLLQEFMVSVPSVTLEENPRLTREGYERLHAYYRLQEKHGNLFVKGTTEDLSDLNAFTQFN